MTRISAVAVSHLAELDQGFPSEPRIINAVTGPGAPHWFKP
jgi:hypothetical protein